MNTYYFNFQLSTMKRFILFTLFILFSAYVVSGEKTKGFTVDLIHRDSPQSPFFNASVTRFRSYNSSKFQSIAFPSGGEYLVKYSVGTPPLEQFAVVDTGSDLIWLQCHPCAHCYSQRSPIFYPHHSASYMNIPCTSQSCAVIRATSCADSTNNRCVYEYKYGDQSFTNGVLATDTLTFNSDTSRVEFPNIIIGCGYNNSIISTQVPSGVIGLARGPASLNTQLSNILQEKFSYCLVPPEISGSNSKLRFGKDADFISGGADVVSTPLLSYDDDHFYYLRLEGITIGNNRINNYDPTVGGNMIIDSGTLDTILNPRLYTDLEAAVRGIVGMNAVRDPHEYYRLCYQTESFRRIAGDLKMIFHFSGGADISLGKTNIFLDVGDGITCLAMIPQSAVDYAAFFGSRAQINFNVQYDVVNNRISFAAADCTTYT